MHGGVGHLSEARQTGACPPVCAYVSARSWYATKSPQSSFSAAVQSSMHPAVSLTG